MRAWILFLGLRSRWLRLSWGPWILLGSMISSKFDVCLGACLSLWVLLVDKEMDWGISCIQGGWSQPSRESRWSQPLVPNALLLFTLMLFTLHYSWPNSLVDVHPHHSPSVSPFLPLHPKINQNAHILKPFCWIFLSFGFELLNLLVWISLAGGG